MDGVYMMHRMGRQWVYFSGCMCQFAMSEWRWMPEWRRWLCLFVSAYIHRSACIVLRSLLKLIISSF